MEVARAHKLRLIEDNAQAIGATYKGQPTGSFGDVACTSFYPTKNLGAAGDAGMLVTNDERIADRLKCLRAHGSRQRYYHDELGVNSRLDELQAVVLLTKLPYLEQWNANRNTIAHWYNRALEGCAGLVTPSITYATAAAGSGEISHVWHQYTVRVTSELGRDAVVKQLAEKGIGSMCYYPVPLHLQNAFAHLGYKRGDFPVSETLAQQVLSLPMFPELSKEQVETVAQGLKSILGESAAIFSPNAVSAPAVAPV
jgi:dTDP-4-amino-4,6-dideoxygalactose transaminase